MALSISSQQSAEQAEAAAMGARQVLNLVDGGDIGQAKESVSLKAKVNQIAEQILHLSETTNQIGSISSIVSELANQTNMLALNAAVEAVRAGEHGKGFSVVASEIRKLAEQSRKSAEKIGGLVTDIQRATNSTVMVTDEGTKTVESIVAAIGGITANSQQISLTAKQQAIAIRQVVEAMTSINHEASQVATSIIQTKTSTQQLNEAATNLQTVV
ncbi:MAG: methyl-accepting chemotaxis protein [Leptolyngbyaceae cyanobacterium bins.59]|nr:methyl-accepting chemotaxis protein [Leptolyngbyaceae cyanobacterium bins.59]